MAEAYIIDACHHYRTRLAIRQGPACMDKCQLALHIDEMNQPRASTITLSIRLDLPDGTRFGPGKAALLTALQAHGSISSAARALGMSYPKALRLIEEMNGQFASPLVETYQGGADRGGANITVLGAKINDLYKKLTTTAGSANRATLNALMALC